MIKKIFTLLCLCTLCIGSAWGEEVTMSYSSSSTTNMTGNNDAATVGLNATSWSVVGDKGGNNNFPGLNKAGQIRLYGSNTSHNTITVTNLDNYKITSIKVTYGESNYNAKVTVGSAEVTGTGSNTEKTYAINSTSFTIAHNYSTTTQVYISSIVITYASTTPTRTLQSIYIDGETSKLEYFVGDRFDHAGLKVMGKYDTGVDTEITKDITWSFNPEVFALGNTSVIVTATVGDVTSEAITVNGITVSERTFASTYTSNVELSTEGGTSASEAKVVIDGTEYDAIKAGTGKVQGACKVTIPANTKTLHFHAAGWNGETVVLNGTINLVADAGVANNSPFTLQNDPEEKDYFTLDPKGATEITFTATSGKRFVLFGVNAEPLKTQKVTITAAKYATLGLPYAVTIPTGVSAYTATVSGSTVTMTKIQTGKIPANCGVILYAETPDTYTFTETANVDPIEDNKLVAALEDYTCPEADKDLVYYLGKDGDNAVFKKLTVGGTIAAGKAYLKLDAAISGAKLDVTFGEPTGIESLTPALSEGKGVYNLNGMKVNEAYKGIVIMNGKKYINK